jgi:hypothetical protein
MKVGTKSLLFGVHQVILHPMFVLVAWIKLYGWRTLNFPTIVAIVIHDWGYWGCEAMDDKGGKLHPVWAALKLNKWFGYEYYHLARFHSRFLAKNEDCAVSKLCLADKLGTAMMPTWLWVLLAKLSTELIEYMSDQKYEINSDKLDRGKEGDTPSAFFQRYKNIAQKWVDGTVPLEPWKENK